MTRDAQSRGVDRGPGQWGGGCGLRKVDNRPYHEILQRVKGDHDGCHLFKINGNFF
jgi:hypothetical protein